MNPSAQDIQASNIDLLKRIRPQLWEIIEPYMDQPFPGQIIPCLNGLLNLQCKTPQGDWQDIHPLPDPKSEATIYTDIVAGKAGQLIFMLGFGLGYEAIAVCEQAGKLNHIHFLDPEPIFFAQAMKFIDLSSLIINKNIHIHLGITLEDLPEIAHHLDRWYLLHAPPHMIRNLRLLKIYPEFYNAATTRLGKVVTAQYMQSNTTANRGMDMLINTFQNVPNMMTGLPLESLRHSHENIPAVLVAAGPSLKKNIRLLKGMEKRCVIMAVDTAVPRLVDEGIKPHFVVAMDYRHRNADSLWGRWDKLEGTALVFLSLSTPYIPKFLRNSKQYFVCDESPVHLWFNDLRGGPETIVSLSSVAHLGFHALKWMGCDPIIFTGLDLSLAGPLSPEEIKDNDLVAVESVNGEPAYATPDFMIMIDKFEQKMAEHPGTYIDATEGGARLRHTRVMPLAEALADHCSRDISFPELPANNQLQQSISHALERLEATSKRFQAMEEACQAVLKKALWAANRFQQLAEKGKPFIRVSGKLAGAVNTVRARHLAIMEGDKNELNFPTSMLDTIMAKKRLDIHKKVIAWRQEHLETQSGTTISEYTGEMMNHSFLCEGMIESIQLFQKKIGLLKERLVLLQKGTLPEPGMTRQRLIALGNIFLEGLDLEEARSCFALALGKDPQNDAANFGMGRVALACRNSPEALAHFKVAQAGRPALAENIRAILGAVSKEYLEAAKDRIARKRSGAEKYLQDILPGFPGYEEARSLLETLRKNQ